MMHTKDKGANATWHVDEIVRVMIYYHAMTKFEHTNNLMPKSLT